MLKGSLWMSAGNLISRLLGAVYVIPWLAWLGANAGVANSLYSMGYNIYALFLLISSVGIPAAISKQTAYYNSIGEYALSKKLFKTAIKFMTLIGLVCAIVMFFASPFLASWAGGGADLVPVMRSLSIGVLVFPSMSVIRGYFNGNNNLAPVAISQIFEQIARVFYLLLMTFIIMRVMDGNYVSAVVQSTFAAFIGMIASYGVLLWYLKKEKPVLDALEKKHGKTELKIDTKDLLIETVRQAVPFIIVGSGIQLFRLVDQYTFINLMSWCFDYSRRELLDQFALFAANPDKLTMVVIAFATSISATGLPLITQNFAQKKKKELATLVSNNIQLFLFIMLPSVFGMMILAYPLNTLFFWPSNNGASLLFWAAAQSLILAFFMLTSNMLQGIYQNRYAIKYLLMGLVVKIVAQLIFVPLFGVYGPLLATFLGFLLTCWLTIKRLHKITRFNKTLVLKRGLLLLILALIMAIVTLIAKHFFGLFLSTDRKVTSFLLVVLCATIGGGVYTYLALVTRIADKLLGARVVGIRRRLKMR
ncbi:MAG: polysaccharide biosynthesis protein [Streptococcaceae bacterium]|nr:polysaccharide biosynthesis protein [Streptococcaceae bacterium]